MRFAVLGPVTIDDSGMGSGRHGATGTIGRPKDRAVLAAMLVDAGRIVGVPTLLERVWGEDAGSATLSSLHVAVSRLRKRLGDSAAIRTEPPGYRLVVAPGDVDSLRFAALVTDARRAYAAGLIKTARAHLDEAFDLWRGEPYADVQADFIEQEAARLWDLRLAAIELASELDLLLGDHDGLADRLPALVTAHPLREGLRATLMTALYRTGRQVEAIELFEATRERFAEELGIDPSPALQRLHTMILRQDPALAAPEDTRAVPQRPARPLAQISDHGTPIVGRVEELSRLAGAWTLARAGRPVVVLISGEAGVGKTRLVEEFWHHAAAADGDVGWGRCADGGPASPYWPWVEALSDLARDRGQAATVRALAGRAAPAAALLLGQTDVDEQSAAPDGPVGARQRLFDGVVAFLSALAAERPVLVVLEDLHWADDETVRLTEHVLGSAEDVRLAFALTVREPDERAGAATRDIVAAAGRAPSFVHVTLQGLNVSEVQAFASARLDRAIGASVAERLHRRTNGNPFFIAELVRLLADERDATGQADLEVPKTVQAVLERRFAYLAAETRRTLAAAAVVGRTFDLRILATVLASRPLHLADVIDEASASGILIAGDTPSVYRFTHALVQETLLAGLGRMRRAALHAAVAEAVEAAAPDPRLVAAEIARHLHAAGAVGDPIRAVRFDLLAAEVSLQRSAYEDAEEHLRRAVATAISEAGTTAAELELEARTRLGELLTLRLGYNAPAVVEERRRTFDLAVEVGSGDQLLSALWGAWGIALVSGDLDEAEALAQQMRQAGEPRGDAMLLLAHHIALGQVFWHRGHLAAAEALLGRAVALADGHLDEVRLDVFMQHPAANARAWQAIMLTLMGDLTAADRISAEGRAFSDRLGHEFTSNYLDVLESWRAIWSRRIPKALEISDAGLRRSIKHGFDQLSAFCVGALGWAQSVSGDPTAGIPNIRASIAAFESLPAGNAFGSLLHGVLAEALLIAGDSQAALAEARAALIESERTGERFFLPAIHLTAARALRAVRAAPEAVAAHVDAAESVAQSQQARFYSGLVAELAPGLTGTGPASER